MRRFKATLFLALATVLAIPVYGESLSFDFGSSTQVSGGNINDVSPQTQDVDNSIRLSDGAATLVDLTITSAPPAGSAFAGFATAPNPAGTQAPGSPATNFFDIQATRDSLFGFTSAFQGNTARPSVEYLISGLNPGESYDFTFFGSRDASDIRETKYDVDGNFSLLNTGGNVSGIASVAGAVASGSGELTLTISAGPNTQSIFYYLGAMQIDGDFATVPEPTSAIMLLLGMGTLGLSRKRR